MSKPRNYGGNGNHCKKCGRSLMEQDWPPPMSICLRCYTLSHLIHDTLNPKAKHVSFEVRLHNLKLDIRQIISSERCRYFGNLFRNK